MTKPGAFFSAEGSQKRRAGSLMILGAETMVKSCAEAETQSKKGTPRLFDFMLVKTLLHHRNR